MNSIIHRISRLPKLRHSTCVIIEVFWCGPERYFCAGNRAWYLVNKYCEIISDRKNEYFVNVGISSLNI